MDASTCIAAPPPRTCIPAHWDFTAGGVVLDGEDPFEGARRELEEELGVTSELESLGESDYADEHTRYHAFRYVTTWDGPITPQPEEVAYGAWLSLERLLERMAEPDVPFMPDSRALFGDWLRERAAGPRRAARGLGHRGHRGRGHLAGPGAALPRRRGPAAQRGPADAAAGSPAAAAGPGPDRAGRVAAARPAPAPPGRARRPDDADPRRRAPARGVPPRPSRHAGQHLRRVRDPRADRGPRRAAWPLSSGCCTGYCPWCPRSTRRRARPCCAASPSARRRPSSTGI